MPELLQHHFEQLHVGSGLPVDVIREREYRSVLGEKELQDLGFGKVQHRPPGLLLPVWGPDGANTVWCYRPDHPRIDARGRELKYELPARQSARLDVPPRCRSMLGDPAVPIWITEGVKKADALAAQGYCAAALLGVWLFKGKNEHGGVMLLTDFDLIAWNGRTVRVVFDSDWRVKVGVREALDRFTAHLERKRAKVVPVYLPGGPNDAKVGVDDFLVTHGAADLEALLRTPAPVPVAAAPVVELLEEAPETLDRPLALLGEHSYAATWLWQKTKLRESIDKHGKIVRHDPPIVTTQRELHIVRSDGTVYGPGGGTPLEDVGIEVMLPVPPKDGKLWRTAGVLRYQAGQRPDPVDVFSRLVRVFDHFIDFKRSFASQQALCELSACCSLQTWFAPAFTVLGYPWPNGERGCGKTHWGNCWANTSYLGEVLLSSGSFAALRDLAAYGATLLFDDAEVLGDPRKCDAQKRELFLAGNRKGTVVTLMELAPDGKTWRTRWVNAFCPRGFTAISLPDQVLASRSIIIPLARTADPTRGNRDPAESKRWPHNQQQLQDDLWALALWLLPEAQAIWAELDDEDGVVGREFEPWRALLAVARLMERHGAGGLEGRLRQSMHAYQAERVDLLDGDRTVLVVRALLDLLGGDTSDASDASDTMREGRYTADQVSEVVRKVAEADERDAEWASPSRIGRILKGLRLKRADRTGTKRGWLLSAEDARALALAYGIASRGRDTSNDVPDEVPVPLHLVSQASQPSLVSLADEREGEERVQWAA